MDRSSTSRTNAKTSQFILSQFFSIGSLKIRYYSICFAIGIIVGYLISTYQAKLHNIKEEQFELITFWVIIIGFIFARLYHVFSSYQYYIEYPIQIFETWHGGLGIYGGIVGGLIALIYFSRKFKLPFALLSDIYVFGLPIGQAIGRVGNYFNYEAFGGPTMNIFKMYVPPQFRPQGFAQYQYFHPTFFYEAVWDIIVFLILIGIQRMYRRQGLSPKYGLYTGLYMALYSFGRFFIEMLRIDSVFIAPGIKLNYVVSALFVALGLVIIGKTYATQTH